MSPNNPLRKPKLRPYFYIIPMDNERVQLRSTRKVMLLRGKKASALISGILPYLDGRYSVDEIVTQLEGFSEQEVMGVLGMLQQRGLIKEGDIEAPSTFEPEELARLEQQLIFFEELDGDPFASQQILKESQVTVWAADGLLEPLVMALTAAGIGKVAVLNLEPVAWAEENVEYVGRQIRSVEDACTVVADADLTIVATKGPSPTLLGRFNKAALQTDVPLIPIQLNAVEAIVGPTIHPRLTACYTCYELRRQANEPFYDEYLAYEEYLDRTPHQRQVGVLAPACGLVANAAAWEAVRVLTQFTLPGLSGNLLLINLFTLETESQRVLKLPRCPTCGQIGPPQKIWRGEEE